MHHGASASRRVISATHSPADNSGRSRSDGEADHRRMPRRAFLRQHSPVPTGGVAGILKVLLPDQRRDFRLQAADARSPFSNMLCDLATHIVAFFGRILDTTVKRLRKADTPYAKPSARKRGPLLSTARIQFTATTLSTSSWAPRVALTSRAPSSSAATTTGRQGGRAQHNGWHARCRHVQRDEGGMAHGGGAVSLGDVHLLRPPRPELGARRHRQDPAGSGGHA
eukprot:6213064-Pleurochrysis_carterae.AAC.3